MASFAFALVDLYCFGWEEARQILLCRFGPHKGGGSDGAFQLLEYQIVWRERQILTTFRQKNLSAKGARVAPPLGYCPFLALFGPKTQFLGHLEEFFCCYFHIRSASGWGVSPFKQLVSGGSSM